jgi:hypothetical protein
MEAGCKLRLFSMVEWRFNLVSSVMFSFLVRARPSAIPRLFHMQYYAIFSTCQIHLYTWNLCTCTCVFVYTLLTADYSLITRFPGRSKATHPNFINLDLFLLHPVLAVG